MNGSLLPALVVVTAAVALGLRWYERSRPSSRVLALVATLAALAAIGRVAFAPVPNVKPTTDIVLVAGFVLGPAPGFAVGAFAALTSNFLFGQGPWTVWQILAWGGCGALGGLLGLLTGGRIGRWPLALACAFAGLGFGTVMNLQSWLTVTGGGREELLVILGSSLPFDLAHAAGNLVFALLLGPAAIVALQRTVRRREGRFVPAGTLDDGAAAPDDTAPVAAAG